MTWDVPEVRVNDDDDDDDEQKEEKEKKEEEEYDTKKKKKATKGSTGGRRVTKVGEKTDAPARVRTRSWTMDLRREENKVTSPYARMYVLLYTRRKRKRRI